MNHVLDLRHRHFVRKGRLGLILIGTWIWDEDRLKHRPCMVLMRERDEMNEHFIPCVVTQDNAWIWSEEVGDPARSLPIAFEYARALRLDEHNPRTIIKIGMTIADHLDDLLHIPPWRTETVEQTAVADFTIKNHRTGRTQEVEILDDV